MLTVDKEIICEWIDVTKELPEDGEWIVYTSGSEFEVYYGRYCCEDDPMPSSYLLKWERVKYWMRLPKMPDL